jgi:hypothetical protein
MNAVADGGGAGGGGELRLGSGTAARLAARHEQAAASITSAAASMPGSVDGGLASALLARIVAGVATTADDLAIVNEASAILVTHVDEALGETDAEVMSGFTGLREVIS